MRVVRLLSLSFLTLVFLSAGLDKAFHYPGFVSALRNYILIPQGAAPFLAMPVILLELGVGLGLCFHLTRPRAALGAIALLALFTLALGLNYLNGDRSICGCYFTITLGKGTKMHLMYNLLLIGLAIGVWQDTRHSRLQNLPSRTPSDSLGVSQLN